MTEQNHQLNLGLEASFSLPSTARTGILREAGFALETTDPDVHLYRQPPPGQLVFDASDAKTLEVIGTQIADLLEGL